MKLRLVIEYDGPNLSDAGSVIGSRRGDGTESGWDDAGDRSRYSLSSRSRPNHRAGGRAESNDLEDWYELEDDGSSVASSNRSSAGRNRRDSSRQLEGERRWRGARRGGPESGPMGGEGWAGSAPPPDSYWGSQFYEFRQSPPLLTPPLVPPQPGLSDYAESPPRPPHNSLPNTHLSQINTALLGSEASYSGPPGRPAPLLSPPTPSALVNGASIEDTRSSSSGSSSRGSGPSRAGRRHRTSNLSSETTPETTPERELASTYSRLLAGAPVIPHSAPPTYTSGSSNGDARDTLERRWLRAEAERVGRAGLNGKARENGGHTEHTPIRTPSDPLVNGGEGGSYSQPPSSRPSSDVRSSDLEGAFRYDNHLDENGAGPSNHRTQSPAGFSLPNFLADLSLSRMPAPSILSSVPDELLRCCGCSKALLECRYICNLCGPILPEQALSDDGTRIEGRNGGDNDDDSRSDAGTVITLSESEGSYSEFSDASSRDQLLSDPLGVVQQAAAVKHPKSPPISSPTIPSVQTGHSHNSDHTHDSPPPLCCPVLAYHTSLVEGALVPASGHDMAHHRLGEEDRGGYELCFECVEVKGVDHANEMSRLAKERGLGDGESQLELRHSFGEVMRMAKSSIHGWREVDYEDDVNCSTCGAGPVQTNRFKCKKCFLTRVGTFKCLLTQNMTRLLGSIGLSCVKFELCLSCYRTVEEIHPVHAFLAVPDRPARPRAGSMESVESPSSSRHATQEEMRLAFLRARGVVGSNGERLIANGSDTSPTTAPRPPPKPMKHQGVLCFGCLGDIVGPRYSCAVCPSFDLCTKLEPPITSPDGRHEQSHILLKISVPVQDDWFIDEASDRARMMTRSREGSSVRRRRSPRREVWSSRPGPSYDQWGPPPPPLPPSGNYSPYGPPPPHYFPTSHRGGPNPYAVNLTGQQYGGMPLQPLALPGSVDQLNTLVHQVMCRGCSKVVRGVRWMCAQCGTSPTFDLCSFCERSSHLIHNPLHCFLVSASPDSEIFPITNYLFTSADYPTPSETSSPSSSAPASPLRSKLAGAFRVVEQQWSEQPFGKLGRNQ
ncbi:hypothetical protein P7C70_g6126, partial [Phenoliferia sp. Uapishka_3]